MLNRFNGNVEPFASDATGTNRTVFGDTVQSDDIDDNLNADFKKGWETVGVNDNPTKQDFNALAFTVSSLISYLYQQGVATWNTNQDYFVNGYCVGSDGKLYRAKTGTSGTPNTGNDPISDSVNWESLDGKFVDLLNAQTIAGIKTFSSFPVTPSSEPTTDYQVVNKKYVDDKGRDVATANEIRTGTNNEKVVTPQGIYDTIFGMSSQTLQGFAIPSERANGATLLNSTGRIIAVFIRSKNSANDRRIYVDGVEVCGHDPKGNTGVYSLFALVPNNSTYRYYSSDGEPDLWQELR